MVVWRRYCYLLLHLRQITLRHQVVQDVLGDKGANLPSMRWSRFVKGIPSDESLEFLSGP